MAACRIRREILACSLVIVFGANAIAQSLGDLAREQRQKQTPTAQGDAAKKTFSNLDDPQPHAINQSSQTARKAVGAGQLLQIDSPADGTVVNPGQTIKVRVTSSTERTWEFVGVLLSIPNVPPTEVVHSLPVEFSITIPANIGACRRYTLTAMGRTTAGELVESDPVDIDVERPDMPVSLSELNGNSMIAEAQGQTYPLLMLATFSDRSVWDVSESGKLTFHSTDTKIVTVDGTGKAMAMATGTARIIVSYKNPNGPDVRLTIPVTVERFQVTFSPSSLDFGTVRVGSSASLSLTVTNNTFSNMLLMIKAITASGPYSEKDNCTSSSSFPVGAKCEIWVTFTPTEPRQSPGTLNIVDSAVGVASVILMSGNGVQ